MSTDNFVWTDELVKEYTSSVIAKAINERANYPLIWDEKISEFKASKQQSVSKPPLGVMPEWLHKEKRLEEINAAIERYYKEEKEIPNEWLNERLQLYDYMREHGNKQSVSKDCGWEVTAIKNNSIGKIYPLEYWENGHGFNGNSYQYALDCMNRKGHSIHSVRRLSDGEVFSVGDKVNLGQILSFNLRYNLMEVLIDDFSDTPKERYLDELQKVKQPLLTTEINNKMKVNIDIEQADNVASDLADLLCWWEGFKIGLKSAGVDHFIVAENGIEAARNLNVKIKDALKNLKK